MVVQLRVPITLNWKCISPTLQSMNELQSTLSKKGPFRMWKWIYLRDEIIGLLPKWEDSFIPTYIDCWGNNVSSHLFRLSNNGDPLGSNGKMSESVHTILKSIVSCGTCNVSVELNSTFLSDLTLLLGDMGSIYYSAVLFLLIISNHAGWWDSSLF